MYAWYLPKGFYMGLPTRRNDWKNVVVWINNPDLGPLKIVGASMSKSDTFYNRDLNIFPIHFTGYQLQDRRLHHTEVYGSNTSLRFKIWAYLVYSVSTRA
ncbi:hypothetical protein JG688_00015030 [Phytophthora aleatoria]|uniref:Uncharacterized protein n=1 Tax=Phytophthora aleatoria TaxID=2496075 RepID=A0A8J5IGA9_9STRA|nr:hypothetical protein JG688_00015030 [Phytophthora aleatoria]